MKYKIIATDFDGTLLNDKKQISKENIKALSMAKEDGYFIVGVTARTFGSADSVLGCNMELFDYLVLNNGAYLFDVEKKKGESVGFLDRSTLLKIINDVSGNASQIDFVSGTSYYLFQNSNLGRASFIKNVDSIEEVDERIARMNIFFKKEEQVSFYHNMICSKYNNVNCFVMQDSKGTHQWLVINPYGVNKSSTLELLGDRLGVNLEEMIFFGDGLNDLEVISSVGCGVAMGNALDEIKEKADFVTLSNEEDGISEFLKTHLEKENVF